MYRNEYPTCRRERALPPVTHRGTRNWRPRVAAAHARARSHVRRAGRFQAGERTRGHFLTDASSFRVQYCVTMSHQAFKRMLLARSTLPCGAGAAKCVAPQLEAHVTRTATSSRAPRSVCVGVSSEVAKAIHHSTKRPRDAYPTGVPSISRHPLLTRRMQHAVALVHILPQKLRIAFPPGTYDAMKYVNAKACNAPKNSVIR